MAATPEKMKPNFFRIGLIQIRVVSVSTSLEKHMLEAKDIASAWTVLMDHTTAT
jgi:hypothetical protein